VGISGTVLPSSLRSGMFSFRCDARTCFRFKIDKWHDLQIRETRAIVYASLEPFSDIELLEWDGIAEGNGDDNEEEEGVWDEREEEEDGNVGVI
jgi:hypothetical protein